MAGLPQLTPNALAAQFDNKQKYPTFFRGISTIAASASSLAHTIVQLGYASVAIVATTASTDQSTVQEFSAEASRIGLVVVTVQIVATSAQCQPIPYQIAQLKASKRHVLGMFALNNDARCIALAAKAAGLWGPTYVRRKFSTCKSGEGVV